MRAVVITSITGWIASVLIGLEVLLPYLLRRNRLSNWLGTAKIGARSPYLKRMWPHYWLGYLLLLLSLIHSVIPLQAVALRGLNATGLWLATAGLLFLLVQSAIGLWLQDPSLTARATMRSWHYWLMFGVAILVSFHVWLNG
jgi:uncharacterized membrane protein